MIAKRAGRFAAYAVLLETSASLCSLAHAESVYTVLGKTTVDENGVDVSSGYYREDRDIASIGKGEFPSRLSASVIGEGGVLIGGSASIRDSYTTAIDNSSYAGILTLSSGGKLRYFYPTNSSINGVMQAHFESYDSLGGYILKSSEGSLQVYTYYSKDGDEVKFSTYNGPNCDSYSTPGHPTCAFPTTWKRGNGLIATYSYYTPPAQLGTTTEDKSIYLSGIVNNSGYSISVSYSRYSTSRSSDHPVYVPTAIVVKSSRGSSCGGSSDCQRTTALHYIITPTGNNSNYSQDNRAIALLDYTTSPISETTTYYWAFGQDNNHIQQLKAIRLPGSPTSDSVALSRAAGGGRITGFTDANNRSWVYALATNADGTSAITRTSSSGSIVKFSFNASGYYVNNSVSGFPDGSSRNTSFTYDSRGRLTKTTFPSGMAFGLTFSNDFRSNILETRRSAPGFTDLVTSASYASSCDNVKTCDRPVSTIDERLNKTDYTYDSQTGDLTSITRPSPDNVTHTIRPQVRYHYAAFGQFYLVDYVSQCMTLASCNQMSDDSRMELTYLNGTLDPLTITRKAGDGSTSALTSYAYDAFGNIVSTDLSPSNAVNTTRAKYDVMDRLVSLVGPDPDGGGAMKPRASRYTYNANGQVAKIERGTVVNPADDPAPGPSSSFSLLQMADMTYDGTGRKLKDALSSDGSLGTTYAVTQYSYDADGRPQCTAQRMNPATFGSLPSWACSIETGSAVNATYGPDRITSPAYDAAGQVTSVTSAVGVTTTNGFAVQQERSEATYTYTANGKLASVADGKGNLTSYAYDGFDRPFRTCFLTAVTACPSSTGDYEQLTYDAASNVTARRLRDTTSLTYVLDSLNRVTDIQMPAPTPNNNYPPHYEYDNFGRLTLATDNGGLQIKLSYDALGRRVGEESVFGKKILTYDAAGRRTRLGWPDPAPNAFYVTYDYYSTGELKTIYEKGMSILASFAYDDLGRRTAMGRGNGTVTQYGYDIASRLNVQNLLLPAGGGAYSTDNAYTLAYNPAGQITSRSSSNDAYAWSGHYNVNRAYTSDALNRYSKIVGLGTTIYPSYDGRGNLRNAGGPEYVYNSFNNLTDIYGYGYFFYDATGRMNYSYPEQQWFDYDGDQMIAEYSNGSGYPMTRRTVFVPGGDEPVVWYDGASPTAAKHYVATDERGSIVQVTNGSGAVEHRNAYDEYGIPQAGNAGRFQYTGQAWLPDLAMYNYKARLYSPKIGRFMQTDPLGYGDGSNWHAYVGNDPVNATDPAGLSSCPAGTVCASTQVPSDQNSNGGGIGINPFGIIGGLIGFFGGSHHNQELRATVARVSNTQQSDKRPPCSKVEAALQDVGKTVSDFGGDFNTAGATVGTIGGAEIGVGLLIENPGLVADGVFKAARGATALTVGSFASYAGSFLQVAGGAPKSAVLSYANNGIARLLPAWVPAPATAWAKMGLKKLESSLPINDFCRRQ